MDSHLILKDTQSMRSPSFFVALVCSLFSVITTSGLVAQSNNQEVDSRVTEVIDEYIEALGGRMSVEVGSATIKGVNFPSGADDDRSRVSDMTYWYQDGTFAIRFGRRTGHGGSDSFYGYDSKQLWRTKSGSEETLKSEENGMGWMKVIPFIAQQALEWENWDNEITAEDAELDGEEVVALDITYHPNIGAKHYFSKETNLMIASRIRCSGSHLVRYEYKEIEGLMCISAVRIKSGGDDEAGLYDFEMSEFDFGTEIDEDTFRRPDASDEEKDEKEKGSDKGAAKGDGYPISQ